MSHEATNWAIKQRGLKPAAKLVLWHLCDRFNPDFGCFPSQDKLAHDCELPRSTLNVHLVELERIGLIRREQRRNSATRQQESTRYRFPFEPDFPCPETGHGAAEPVSRNEGEPCPENGESRVQNLDTNLVREPVRETLERESASEDEGREENRKAIERAFEKAWQKWPTSIGDSRPSALAAWLNLSADERIAAHEETERYVSEVKATGRKMICSHAAYLKEKRWENLGPRTEAKKAETLDAPAFGALWSVARCKHLVMGPKVPFASFTAFQKHLIANSDDPDRLSDQLRRESLSKTGWPQINAMHERAASHQGVAVSATLEAFKELVEAVPVGSARFEEWKCHHEQAGWPWIPDPGRQPVVYFPVGGPAGLEAFRQAVLGNDHDGNR